MFSAADFINRLNMWVGKAFGWCILILTFGTSYEVFMRYVVGNPTGWAFDMSYIMYGTLLMMGGAYTLSRDGHVRGDVFYRLWPVRVQAGMDLLLYILFFFPAMLALVYAGVDYAAESWSRKPFGAEGLVGEVSIFSPAGVPISPLKTVIPVAAVLLILQGLAEVLRCVICIRDGKWPERPPDIEEMEAVLQEMAHGRQADIERELHLGDESGGAHR